MQFKAKDLALMCSFAALYAVLSFLPLFPVIGGVGSVIAFASVMAPLLGMMLGPYIGVTTVSLGGFIGWSITQKGAFGFLSFVPGAIAAFCSGLLYDGKRIPSVVLYVVLFLPMALYPTIGPVWLYPYFLWFQLIGLILLASPLMTSAIKFMRNNDDIARLSFGVGIISLASTLLGQISGSLLFEIMYWPTVHPQVEYWHIGQWQLLTLVYPVERSFIVFVATLVGVPLIKAIRAYGFQMGGK